MPFELLQQLPQSPAVLADLRTTLMGTDDVDDSAVPGSHVYWTARLSATNAAQQEAAAASSSSKEAEQPQGLHAQHAARLATETLVRNDGQCPTLYCTRSACKLSSICACATRANLQ